MKAALIFFGFFLTLTIGLFVGFAFGNMYDNIDDNLGYKTLHFSLMATFDEIKNLESAKEKDAYIDTVMETLWKASWTPQEYIEAVSSIPQHTSKAKNVESGRVGNSE